MRTKLEELNELVTAALPDSPQLVVLDEPWFCRPDVARLPDPARRSGRPRCRAPWRRCPTTTVVGVHCCAPCDIAMLLASGPERRSRCRCRPTSSNGPGTSPASSTTAASIAWGVIPTDGPIPTTADRQLACAQRRVVLARAARLRPVLLRQQSLVSPQCGLSGHSVARRPAHRPTDVRRRPAGEGSVGSHPALARRLCSRTTPTPTVTRSTRRSGSRRCAPRSPITTSATTRSTNPRSATPTSTRSARELRALEADHPELADESSPTGQVGGAISTTFDPVTHRVPMMSLDNAMNAAELRAWAERVARGPGRGQRAPTFVCELKFDGLAISLRYEDRAGSSRRRRGVTAGSARTSRRTWRRSTTSRTS